LGARPASGRSPLSAHRPILRALGKHRPGDARMFGRQRDGDNVNVPALFEPPRPGAFAVGLFVDDSQIRARSMHQKRTYVAIPLARDLPQSVYAAARVLTRRDAERGSITTPAFEDVRGA